MEMVFFAIFGATFMPIVIYIFFDFKFSVRFYFMVYMDSDCFKHSTKIGRSGGAGFFYLIVF